MSLVLNDWISGDNTYPHDTWFAVRWKCDSEAWRCQRQADLGLLHKTAIKADETAKGNHREELDENKRDLSIVHTSGSERGK